jgi:hypothetical protein
MLNNYLHDLATAIFAVSALAAYFLLRSSALRDAPASSRPLVEGLVKVGAFALAWILLGGVVRGMTYRQYEWMEAAGRGQVTALVVKHVILVSLVVTGLVVLYKVRRIARVDAAKDEIA